MISPKDFEKLSRDRQLEVIHHNDEEVREWYGWCRACKHKIIGKLKDIRGKPCPNCGAK